MKHLDDRQLLQEYARRNSEEAFRILVDRYAGLIYHVALRQSGSPQTAEEVTQVVFIDLAQKAGKIPSNTILSGWLFRAVRFVFANHARGEIRRQHREQEALKMENLSPDKETESVWNQIEPELDQALDELPPKDREAILIRFFQNKTHKELGQVLGVSEDAAKVRISRALEKLRLIFAARGIVVSSSVLLAVFSACSAQAAPAGLSAAIASVAIAKGTVGTSSTLTISKGILKLMAWTKTQTAIAATVLVLATGTTVVVVKSKSGENPSASVETALKKAPEILSNGINNAQGGPDTVYAYPEGDERTRGYCKLIMERYRKDLDPATALKSDGQLSEADIQTKNLVIYGSPKNNKLLQRFRDQLPIRIEDDGIVVGDKKCLGLDVGVIFVCPNPLNSTRQFLIYAAVSPEAVNDLNAIFHGPTDYVVFNNITRQASAKKNNQGMDNDFLLLGAFNKSDPANWRVDPKLQLLPSQDLQKANEGVVVSQ